MNVIEATVSRTLILLAIAAAFFTIVAMLTFGVLGTLALLIASVIVGWLTPSP